MSDQDRLEKAKEKAKKRAEELFKPVPDDMREALENETVLGNPENLIKPDNKAE